MSKKYKLKISSFTLDFVLKNFTFQLSKPFYCWYFSQYTLNLIKLLIYFSFLILTKKLHKIFFKTLSFFYNQVLQLTYIDLQCLSWMEGIEGSLGSLVTAITGLLVCLLSAVFFLFNNLFPGILLALFIAELIIPGLYSLFSKTDLSSWNLVSLCFFSVQTLTILRAKENGMFWVVWFGWHELGSRYWFLSVGFLYRSTEILLFFIDREVSRYGIDCCSRQEHLESLASPWIDVWDIVSLIAGCFFVCLFLLWICANFLLIQ